MKISRRTLLQQSGVALMAVSAASLRSHAEEPERKIAESADALFSIRECYCPAHFGNAYEAMGPREMAAYLEELKWWGFNRYGDWVTTTDICNPYTSDAAWDLAKEQLDRKKKAFRAAQNLGLALNLIVTPNHVYLDQLRPEYAATKSQKIFGQLVCPSNPDARKLILDNIARLLEDLADAGLRFSAFTAFAYDYGGCDCEKCRPWIITFAKLTKEIHALAAAHHPGIEPWFCSWWWTPEEHKLFNEWAAKESPDWLKGMSLHIEYDHRRFNDIPMPDGCRKFAFIHNGYSDSLKTGDIYAKFAAVVAPRRIPETLQEISRQSAQGFQAYSEGIFDDCNKAILAGVSSGKFKDAREALAAYANRYFGSSPELSQRWAEWLIAWGNRSTVKLPAAAEEFEVLAREVPPSWRLEQWRSKLKLETFDRAIGSPKPGDWTAAKLALVDQFWAEQEHLNRDVYRLGPVRHVFTPKFQPPAWYDSWQKVTPAGAEEDPNAA